MYEPSHLAMLLYSLDPCRLCFISYKQHVSTDPYKTRPTSSSSQFSTYHSGFSSSAYGSYAAIASSSTAPTPTTLSRSTTLDYYKSLTGKNKENIPFTQHPAVERVVRTSAELDARMLELRERMLDYGIEMGCNSGDDDDDDDHETGGGLFDDGNDGEEDDDDDDDVDDSRDNNDDKDTCNNESSYYYEDSDENEDKDDHGEDDSSDEATCDNESSYYHEEDDDDDDEDQNDGEDGDANGILQQLRQSTMAVVPMDLQTRVQRWAEAVRNTQDRRTTMFLESCWGEEEAFSRTGIEGLMRVGS